jgi:alpha-N-acetylglucosaminidase
MGNVDGWAGPLPQTWIIQKSELQKRILARMRQFGMKPILPGFAGHVPAALKSHYPKADIVQVFILSYLSHFFLIFKLQLAFQI